MMGQYQAGRADRQSGLGQLNFFPLSLDLLEQSIILHRPAAYGCDRLMNAFTRSGQRVLGSWRYVFVNLAVDEAVGFQLPQNLYQHLLRDAGDAAMQFTEPDGTARKAINDDGRPFVGD